MAERPAALGPGDVLGGRFAILGVIGRGGSATVFLADDRVRHERVALKVLHAHLVADRSARRRLRREVEASGRIRHPGALVAHDLHELDGQLALSMPYHAGRTLGDQVRETGPLPAATVTSIATQLAEALAASHRAGVLHRDISPSNVLIDESGAVVLSDFGLARVGEAGTRSTGVLGTVGYAAPEIWEGRRADPRSDLYALGAVVYLAAAGKPPYDAPSPVAALQQQLEGSHTPLAEVRPDLPRHVTAMVDALLAPAVEARPPGARAVVDALRDDAWRPSARGTPTAIAGPVRWFEEGSWAVVLHERSDDELRRAGLRAKVGREPNLVVEALHRVARQVREMLDMPAAPSPEEQLVRGVARLAGLPDDALEVPPAVFDKKFRLIEGVDRDTADRLAELGKLSGFKPRVVDLAPAAPGWGVPASAVGPLIAAVWVAFGLLSASGAIATVIPLLVAILVTILLPQVAVGERGKERKARALVRAFEPDLRAWLTDDHRDAVPPIVDASAPDAEPARDDLPSRARSALADLRETVDALAPTLPDPAVVDLRHTTRVLAEQVDALASRLQSLEGALGQARPEDVAWAEARLARLETLARAGERVDPGERDRREQAIARSAEADAAAERLDARRTACLAQLLEIASTARRVQRDLLATPEPARAATEQVRWLEADVRAVRQALAEGATR